MTTHLTDIEISAFRGLKDITLKDCGDVNLLVGGNNSGKTSVLEAIYLLAAPHSIERWYDVQRIRSAWPLSDFHTRGQDKTLPIEWYFPRTDGELESIQVRAMLTEGLFPESVLVHASAERFLGFPPDEPKNTENEIEEGRSTRVSRLERTDSSEEVIGLRIKTFDGRHPFTITMWEGGMRRLGKSPPRFHAEVVNSIAHRSDSHLSGHVSKLIKSKRKPEAEEMYRRLDRRVLSLEIADSYEFEFKRRSPPTVNVEYTGVGFVPIQAMGDGMRRALLLSAVVSGMKGGVLLIDEVEVGMHTTVLKDVFKWLTAACKKAGIQVFMTTHSLEAIDAIIESVDDEDLVLYRLSNGDVKRYDGELLRTSRFDFGYEVR